MNDFKRIPTHNNPPAAERERTKEVLINEVLARQPQLEP